MSVLQKKVKWLDPDKGIKISIEEKKGKKKDGRNKH
jgi:hypothetical protein